MQKSANSATEVLGNTEPKTLKIQDNACLKYCFTYNNYKNDDINDIKNELDPIGLYLFGLEIGKSGTPHIQGWIHLKKKMRITEFKKFSLLKHCHFEKQIAKDEQAIKYCMKDGKIHSNFDYSKYEPEEPLEIIKDLYEWQKDIVEIISEKADKRTVYWFWEEVGGVGKSEFCKYLCHHHKATYIDEGKKSDLINIIFNLKNINSKSIICIDVPRNNTNNVSYKAIEQIKNGMICNTKYETGSRIFNSPHIIIFSNYYPEKDKLSMDRWKIAKIMNKKLVWDRNEKKQEIIVKKRLL